MTKNFDTLESVARHVAYLESNDPYAALHFCKLLVDYADDHTAMLVKILRDRDGSWADIGAALGVSKQAAHQRYGRHCGES